MNTTEKLENAQKDLRSAGYWIAGLAADGITMDDAAIVKLVREGAVAGAPAKSPLLATKLAKVRAKSRRSSGVATAGTQAAAADAAPGLAAAVAKAENWYMRIRPVLVTGATRKPMRNREIADALFPLLPQQYQMGINSLRIKVTTELLRVFRRQKEEAKMGFSEPELVQKGKAWLFRAGAATASEKSGAGVAA